MAEQSSLAHSFDAVVIDEAQDLDPAALRMLMKLSKASNRIFITADANQSIYGLNGAVLTHDADKAYDVARKVRTGAIGQGGLKLDFALPFGGFKQSGVGREGGAEGILPYLETKTILLD